MRFTSRATTATSTPDDALHFRGGGTAAEPPQKAELIFGARTRLGRKKVVKGGAPWESDELQQRQQQGKNLGAEPWAQDRGRDLSPSPLEEDMADRRAKLNVWPNLERENRSTPDVSNGRPYPPSMRPGIPPRRTSSNAVSDYYNPSKQPYYVSQQTSDSAVRDMGLRKPPPMTIHETASDPALARRPLKSALKKHFQPEMKRQASDTSQRLGTSSSEKKPARLNLSHFLPRSQSRNLLSPNTLSRSPSALTDNSDYSPRETVHVQLKRPTANAPFTTHKSVKQPTVDSSPTTRAKVFEPDIYDQAKTNVRRPPKGIQNWFDGVDISTDEDSETETKKQTSPDSHELDASDLSSDFSPWHIRSDSEQPRLDRKGSRDPVEDNLLAIKHAKERIQERMRLAARRKGSVDTVTIASAVSSEVPDRKRGGGSRLALVELASQSVLSLSESSGDDGASTPDARAHLGDASLLAMASGAPSELPPQRLQSKRSIPSDSVPRQSTSTVQTSGSIPIRLTDSIPLPTALPTAPEPKRAPRTTTTAHSDPTAQALRKLTGQATPRSSRSRRSTIPPPPIPTDYPDEVVGSPGAETTTTTTNTSLAPSDPSHLMAVSEEEMILLEMMRNKRAAMQSSSFAEGYQLALKREQELMVKRRESAQQTALKILRQREDSNKLKSQRSSRATAPPLLLPDDGESEGVEEGYRRKYSALRREEVDAALKLEKFLADGGSGAKTPTAEDFPEAPGFGGEAPVHGNRSGRRLSAHQFDFDALLLGPEQQRTPAVPVTRLEKAGNRESKQLNRKRSQKHNRDRDPSHHNAQTSEQQPYKLTPDFDFSPLDFPSPSHLIPSPSRPKTPLVAAPPPPPPPLSSSTLSSTGKPSTLDTTAGAGAASSSEEAGSLRRFHGFGFGFGGARAWTPDTEVSGVASASASASASVSAAASVSGPLVAMAPLAKGSRKARRERSDAAAAAAAPPAAAPAALMPRKKGPPPRLENLGVLPDVLVKRSTSSRPHGVPLHGSGAVTGGIGGVDSATAPLTTASEDVLAAWAELGGGGTEGLLGSRRRGAR
ncbi:hypothetical protein LTR54_015164 [Friedmanniomyces endolithicus]|nr:hypothetical protein LTS01_023236 [Friedmanniomyces endolithicus]KAK0981032.1 hypothetical protein LTR54_015164 [Friedmanniomyces endolithicus]